MRNNLSITNNEYMLRDGETIVSKTDLQGNITYVNADFVRISGFSEQELIGAPQNIVRHPDMPAEAFADFWSSLQAGKAWTGLVKNRCKNGDHYWVEADAAPLIEGGRVTGYTSIRAKPGRAEVDAAALAYREIKSGNGRLGVREGNIVIRNAAMRALNLGGWSLDKGLKAAAAVYALLFVAMLAALLADGVPHRMFYVACCLGGIAATISVGALMRRDVLAPLTGLRNDIARMSSGDLSGRIRTRGAGELGDVAQGLRVLQTNVKLLVGQIKEVTGIVGSGAAEITAGTADLSARTESQASSLEETAASMEELTSTVRQNDANAQDAHAMMATASEEADKGGAAMKQVVATMAAIQDSSRRIVDIIGVIDGIAFQTNILALNAAVEAARAGEQGRGFAVVASEVRNLAQRAAAAAREIKLLIDDSALRVGEGARLVDTAGLAMDGLLDTISRVAGHMGEISTASREQSEGIEQVNQAVTQMDETTQQNAAMVEQASAAAEKLRQQAQHLAALVDAFTLASTGPAVARGASRRPAAVAAPRRLQLPTS